MWRNDWHAKFLDSCQCVPVRARWTFPVRYGYSWIPWPKQECTPYPQTNQFSTLHSRHQGTPAKPSQRIHICLGFHQQMSRTGWPDRSTELTAAPRVLVLHPWAPRHRGTWVVFSVQVWICWLWRDFCQWGMSFHLYHSCYLRCMRQVAITCPSDGHTLGHHVARLKHSEYDMGM